MLPGNISSGFCNRSPLKMGKKDTGTSDISLGQSIQVCFELPWAVAGHSKICCWSVQNHMLIVGYQLHIWTALVRGSCYCSPGASFIGLPVLAPWLVLPSGILRTADRNRYFLASPSGRQERRGIRHSPLYFSEQND